MIRESVFVLDFSFLVSFCQILVGHYYLSSTTDHVRIFQSFTVKILKKKGWIVGFKKQNSINNNELYTKQLKKINENQILEQKQK